MYSKLVHIHGDVIIIIITTCRHVLNVKFSDHSRSNQGLARYRIWLFEEIQCRQLEGVDRR